MRGCASVMSFGTVISIWKRTPHLPRCIPSIGDLYQPTGQVETHLSTCNNTSHPFPREPFLLSYNFHVTPLSVLYRSQIVLILLAKVAIQHLVWEAYISVLRSTLS